MERFRGGSTACFAQRRHVKPKMIKSRPMIYCILKIITTLLVIGLTTNAVAIGQNERHAIIDITTTGHGVTNDEKDVIEMGGPKLQWS